MMKCKDACKMRFATYIFDAKSHQVLVLTSFLQFARPVPSEMKITKTSPKHAFGRPGGMSGGAGEDMRGSEICKFEICVMDFGCGLDTPCLGFRPRAADSIARRGLAVFNRCAHSAGPGRGKWEEGRSSRDEG